MKHINRLLLKAKALCVELFSWNDDEFIEALGLNLNDFAMIKENEIVGYDDMKALTVCCDEVWKEGEVIL